MDGPSYHCVGQTKPGIALVEGTTSPRTRGKSLSPPMASMMRPQTWPKWTFGPPGGLTPTGASPVPV